MKTILYFFKQSQINSNCIIVQYTSENKEGGWQRAFSAVDKSICLLALITWCQPWGIPSNAPRDNTLKDSKLITTCVLRLPFLNAVR